MLHEILAIYFIFSPGEGERVKISVTIFKDTHFIRGNVRRRCWRKKKKKNYANITVCRVKFT